MYINGIIVASETADLIGRGAVKPTDRRKIDGDSIDILDLKDPTGKLNLKVAELIKRGELDKKKCKTLNTG